MKKTEAGADFLFKKVLNMDADMSIWHVHIERCREQDKNARVMDKETFDRLKSNIEHDGRLESLPFGYIKPNTSGNHEFHIVSGHHRVRAARMANVTEMYVLVVNEDLNMDQIRSKQLAHNAIAGHDDTQVLKELYDSIHTIEERVKSGIKDVDIDKEKYRNVSIDDISLDFDFKVVKFMFLPSQLEKLEEVVKEITEGDQVMVSDKAVFDKFAETLRKLSKNEDIRNVGSLIDKMCSITLGYLKEEKRKKKALEDHPAGSKIKGMVGEGFDDKKEVTDEA